MMMKKEKGFTLLELIVVLIIVGILAALAGPSYSRLIARNRLRSVAHDWRGAFFLAQKEAIRRKHRVELCPSTDGLACAKDDPGTINVNETRDFSLGWIVIDNNRGEVIKDYPPLIPNGNKDKVSLMLNAAQGANLNFLANGRLPAAFAGGNFTVSNKDYLDLNMQFNISRGGRIQNAK